MSRRKITVEPAGTDAQQVRLLGDRTQPEPSTFLVKFPGGDVEVTRTNDGSYWVHVRAGSSTDSEVIEGLAVVGELAQARVDYAMPDGELTSGEEIGFRPNARHVAVLVRH